MIGFDGYHVCRGPRTLLVKLFRGGKLLIKMEILLLLGDLKAMQCTIHSALDLCKKE